MNATQLKTISQLWASVNTSEECFTAREMMLEPGRCLKTSDLFYHADGRKFVWMQAKEMYVRYE